jgi:hypothetical protein
MIGLAGSIRGVSGGGGGDKAISLLIEHKAHLFKLHHANLVSEDM